MRHHENLIHQCREVKTSFNKSFLNKGHELEAPIDHKGSFGVRIFLQNLSSHLPLVETFKMNFNFFQKNEKNCLKSLVKGPKKTPEIKDQNVYSKEFV